MSIRETMKHEAKAVALTSLNMAVYDAKRFGVAMPKDARMTLQERGYTSPIWYTPAK